MFLRKEKNGVYYIYFSEFNRRKSLSTKSKNKSDAFRYLSEFQKRLEERKKGLIEPITILDFKTKFLEYYKISHAKKSIYNLKYVLNNLINHFGKDKIICAISADEIEKYLKLYQPKIKESTLREIQTRVGTLISFAKEYKYLSESFEFRKIKFRIKERMPIYFTIEQFQAFYTQCKKQPIKDISLMAFLTGMRQGELTGLLWKDVFIERGLIILSNHYSTTKTGRVRTIPLCPDVVALLKNLFLKRSNDYVYNTKTGCKWINENLCTIFRNEVKGIFGNECKLTFHSFRHGFASELVKRGVPIYSVSTLLGHSNLATTQIYSHLSADNLKSEVEKIHLNLN